MIYDSKSPVTLYINRMAYCMNAMGAVKACAVLLHCCLLCVFKLTASKKLYDPLGTVNALATLHTKSSCLRLTVRKDYQGAAGLRHPCGYNKILPVFPKNLGPYR